VADRRSRGLRSRPGRGVGKLAGRVRSDAPGSAPVRRDDEQELDARARGGSLRNRAIHSLGGVPERVARPHERPRADDTTRGRRGGAETAARARAALRAGAHGSAPARRRSAGRAGRLAAAVRARGDRARRAAGSRARMVIALAPRAAPMGRLAGHVRRGLQRGRRLLPLLLSRHDGAAARGARRRRSGGPVRRAAALRPVRRPPARGDAPDVRVAALHRRECPRLESRRVPSAPRVPDQRRPAVGGYAPDGARRASGRCLEAARAAASVDGGGRRRDRAGRRAPGPGALGSQQRAGARSGITALGRSGPSHSHRRRPARADADGRVVRPVRARRVPRGQPRGRALSARHRRHGLRRPSSSAQDIR